MKSLIKRLLNRTFNAFNFEIRKFPATEFNTVPVFDLAVHMLMQKTGNQLFFIQVGANDGIFGDPLNKFIIKYKWKGLLIEPQPEIFKLLVDNYRMHRENLHFENCAISPDQSSLILHIPKITEFDGYSIYKSSVASVSKSRVAKQLRVHRRNIQEIKVHCKTLDSLVMEYHIDNLDILQIDAEGYDYHVLRSLDLGKIRPMIIQFETGHMPGVECKKAVQRLHHAGYEIHWGGNHGDAVAIHQSLLVE